MKNIFLFLYEIILCDSIGQNRLGNNIKIIELSPKPILTKSFLMVSVLTRLVKNGRERNVIKTILNNVRKTITRKLSGIFFLFVSLERRFLKMND